jgi:amidase/aspartyl-tRNA(Asn)/glutamyl-tRNA(Gln) amidotransferase subunit A
VPRDLAFRTATELASDVRRGVVSPVEVVGTFLDSIDDRNGTIGAFVHVMDEEARTAARAAKRAVERGDDLGPLHGVPVAVKDLEDVAGVPTTYGSKPLADTVPEEDGPVVRRLREAGAIVLGKTNTPEFGHKGVTDNPLFGPTSTPFDTARNAGGSSGGSAAAVADGLVPLAQGSDGGGSVRIPSAWCGVVGFKGTFRRAAYPAEPDAFTHSPFLHVGPHARTVEDAALLFEVMAGPHDRDPLCLPDAGTDYRGATDRSVDGLSVAYSPDLGVFPVDERVRTVVNGAVDYLPEAGMDVERVELDFGRSGEEICRWWLRSVRVKYAALADVLAAEHGVDYTGADRGDVTPEFAEAIERGEEYGAKEYMAAGRVRTDVFRGFQRAFEEHDLLVAPTLSVPPVENADDGTTLGPTAVGGEAVNPLIGWCLTYPFNMSGHPVASVPAGVDDEGLPVGMQVAGRRFADETVLAASAAFERVRPWDDLYPPRA